MFKIFLKIIKNSVLLNKILLTLVFLFLYRFLYQVPLLNINRLSISSFYENNSYLSIFDFISGGNLSNLSLASLGIQPYISASIIIQLLTLIIPKLETLQKDGLQGRMQINKYVKILTLVFTLVQSIPIVILIMNQGYLVDKSNFSLLLTILNMVCGSMIVIWIADQITNLNIANGTSLIIFTGIVSRIPAIGYNLLTSQKSNLFNMAVFAIIFLAIVFLTVYINEAYRKIIINYSKSISNFNNNYLPLKVNSAGVMPLIFAVSLVYLPSILGNYISGYNDKVGTYLVTTFSVNSIYYNIFLFLLVFLFTFFWTSFTFNPTKISEDIKERGGFIKGVRPGLETKEYFNNVLTKITFIGATFLGILAILPSLVGAVLGSSNLSISGSGLLIVVSVAIELFKKIESFIIMENYKQPL